MKAPAPHSQSLAIKGNALFLILIAVALFAALSYAVTQTGRGGGSTRKEQQQLAVSQMLQYASLLQQTVTRMMLMNGCTEATLNFASSRFNQSGTGGYVNGSAPMDHSCDVFHPNGGGVTWQAPPASILDSTVPEYNIVSWYSVGGVGTTASGPPPYSTSATADVVLLVHITREACLLINSMFNISMDFSDPVDFLPRTNAQVNPPLGTGDAFDGTYTHIDNGSSIGGHPLSPSLTGVPTGCIRMSGNTKAAFYSVLLAR